MKRQLLPFAIIFLVCTAVFYPVFKGNLPIPSDTLIGLYHPFRDLYIDEYPNGIPFKNFLITDPIRQQYPWRFLAIEEFRNLNLPLWNPYSFAGTPLLGNVQAAVFYPLNIFFLIIPFKYSWSFLVFLQPVLMGGFLFFYLRQKQLSAIASLFASISIAFSGFSVAWMEWNTVLQTALWLPLILLSIDKVVDIFQRKATVAREYVLWSIIFIFSLVSSLFAGHLQTFFYLVLLSFAYFLARLLQQSRKMSLAIFMCTLFFISLIVTSVQWIPSLQFILLSARDVDRVWTEPGWFIPLQHFVQFIAPDFFGNPTTLNYFGTWNYAEFVGYIGIIPFTFAVFAMLFVRRKAVYFFTFSLVCALLFSFDNMIARLPFELAIPFLSTSQPTRLLFIVDFSLVVLSAFGMNHFQKDFKKFFIPLSLVALMIGLLWFTAIINPFGLQPENALVAKRNLYVPSFLFLILLMTYLTIRFVKYKRVLIAGLTILFIATSFDSLRFAQKFLAFSQSDYLYPDTSAMKFLQNQSGVFRIMSLDSRILPPNTSIMYGIQTIEGYDPLYLLRYGELIAAIERNNPDISSPFGFNRIVTPHRYDSDFASFLNVKYVLSLNEVTDSSLTKVFEEGTTKIYQNNDVLPRAFSIKRVIPVSTKAAAIEELFANKNNLANVAIVENFTDSQKDFSPARVEIETYEPNNVAIRVSAEKEAFVVLTDSFYPTWKATIENGYELQIYQTNYNFRGIVVPPGVHRVEFRNRLF